MAFPTLLEKIVDDEVPELSTLGDDFFEIATFYGLAQAESDPFARREARSLLLRSANRLLGAARRLHSAQKRGVPFDPTHVMGGANPSGGVER